jgi:hypothetical protein
MNAGLMRSVVGRSGFKPWTLWAGAIELQLPGLGAKDILTDLGRGDHSLTA